MNKRGFELIWNTIVIIILAFMLLLFLVLFFTNSSKNFLNNIKNYFSYSNIDSAVSGCNILANSNSKYSYCCEKKEIKYYLNKEKKKGRFSCSELLDEKFVKNLKKLNCENIVC